MSVKFFWGVLQSQKSCHVVRRSDPRETTFGLIEIFLFFLASRLKIYQPTRLSRLVKRSTDKAVFPYTNFRLTVMIEI